MPWTIRVRRFWCQKKPVPATLGITSTSAKVAYVLPHCGQVCIHPYLTFNVTLICMLVKLVPHMHPGNCFLTNSCRKPSMQAFPHTKINAHVTGSVLQRVPQQCTRAGSRCVQGRWYTETEGDEQLRTAGP
jgi:hypothetical protein